MVRPIPQRSSMTSWDHLNERLQPKLKRKRIMAETVRDLMETHNPPTVTTHPFLEECENCTGKEWALFSVLLANSVRTLTSYCTTCGVRSGHLPHTFYDPFLCPVYKDNRELRCSYCGELGAELHHYAPKHLFEDSHEWGTIPLCIWHHREWHRIVTPNMSHTRRKA